MKLTGDHRLSYLAKSGPSTAKKSSATPSASVEAPQGPRETFTASAPAPTGPVAPTPLTKAQKKALLENIADGSVKLAQRQAVIIGGGPGGLAAAITLAQLGMKVTVLEARANETGDKPAHARPHQISLRQDSLEMLKKLGAYDQVIEKSGFVQKEISSSTDGVTAERSEKRPEGTAQNLNKFLVNPNTLMTDSVSQVRISDIEKSLYDQARELGIDVRSGVQADLKKSANGTSYDVTVRKVRKDQDTGYAPYGESESLGTPDLVVAADGAGSPTRAALGIEVLEESGSKNYLGGHVQKGISAETHKATVDEGNGFQRHVMGTGHAKYDQTWVSVEITPEEAALSPKERTQLLADKAQYVMGQEIKPTDIGWGAGQLTTVQNRRAATTTGGDNVVLLGDAAGTGSVWVGGGLNLALTTHLSALKNLARHLQGQNPNKPAVLNIYDKTIQWATSTWHKAGAEELGVKSPAQAQAS